MDTSTVFSLLGQQYSTVLRTSALHCNSVYSLAWLLTVWGWGGGVSTAEFQSFFGGGGRERAIDEKKKPEGKNLLRPNRYVILLNFFLSTDQSFILPIHLEQISDERTSNKRTSSNWTSIQRTPNQRTSSHQMSYELKIFVHGEGDTPSYLFTLYRSLHTTTMTASELHYDSNYSPLRQPPHPIITVTFT